MPSTPKNVGAVKVLSISMDDEIDIFARRCMGKIDKET
jgi:hypothetical protein